MFIQVAPCFFERIWGGRTLAKYYEIPEGNIGEAWTISGHPAGSSPIMNPELAHLNLAELYVQKPELFGNYPSREYPLLVKFLDAKADLSVQIHPDDEYAKINENSLGKTECWYIVDCAPNSDIIIGQKTNNLSELRLAIEQGKWDEVLPLLPIKKGDFFHIPARTIHAIRKNTVILEIQQSSDVTYRLYDYDRLDDNGQKRELHLEKSLAILQPFYPEQTQTRKMLLSNEKVCLEQLVDDPFFQVTRYELKDAEGIRVQNPNFLQVTCLSGPLKIQHDEVKIELQAGDNYIVSAEFKEVELSGCGEVIISSPQ